MRVLIVNKFLHPNGGSETYIFGLGDALKQNGHEVQYFGMEHEGRCVGNAMNSYTSDMDFHNASKLQKVSYALKTIYSFEARRKIRLVLDDFKPDIVHLNNFNYQLTPSIIVEIVKWRKETEKACKIYFTAHDYQLLCPNHMFNNPLTHKNCEKCLGGHYVNCIQGKCIHGSIAKSIIGAIEAYYWNCRGVYKYFDKIICCSEFMKSRMDENQIFNGKTLAIHNFIINTNYNCDTNHNRLLAMGVDRPYILYFGRYSWEKGVRTLIAACNRLPEVFFVFAGKGEYEDQINKTANALNVGFREKNDLEVLIRNALFTVAPSECYENNPFSVMESQQRSIPVVGADIGGIPELISNERTGLLFSSGDVTDLCKKITCLWNDRSKISAMKDYLKELNRDDANRYQEKIYNN